MAFSGRFSKFATGTEKCHGKKNTDLKGVGFRANSTIHKDVSSRHNMGKYIKKVIGTYKGFQLLPGSFELTY